jgi:hypothetical protein
VNRVKPLDLTKILRLIAVAGCLWVTNMYAVCAQTVARANIERIEPIVIAGQLSMDIDMSLQLNDSMRQALSRGVPLFFSIDLEIDQPRWWWFNKTIVDTSLVRRLSYNTLTRSWRVSTGNLSIPVTSYEDAVRQMTQVRDWPITLSDRFEPDVQYVGRVRMRLDSDQLARPLQLNPINRNDWSLSSAWKSFEFSIRRARPDPS